MKMDYHRNKDAESCQREQRIPKPRPQPRPSTSIAPPTSVKPPIKPRRSIKCRPITQREAGQSGCAANQESEVVVKRIAPCQVLGPTMPLEAQTPSLRAHILLWFQETQMPRLQTAGRPLPCWLHGFSTRREAEQLLQDKPQGCFLLRLSESKVGFVLSYRGADRCRHFIIEEEREVSGMSGQYVISGESSRHGSLDELINYYTHNPVGPFSETLTVPCKQPTTSGEETAGQDENSRDGGEDGHPDKKTQTTLVSVPEEAPAESACQPARQPSESADYAVVRKPLRKTYSLPESPSVAPTAPNGDQSGMQEPADDSVIKLTTGNLDRSTDAPYARVNKPPRATPQPTPICTADLSIQGAAAAVTYPSFHSSAASAEQKYWELEPPHTYEETPHSKTRTQEIDFYAMGRRRDIADDAELSGHHVYSEVNIRGSRDGIVPPSPLIRPAAMSNFGQSVTWPNPVLAGRLPPRSAHASLPAEDGIQGFAGSPVMTSHLFSGYTQSEQSQPENSGFSIYEQIPERPASSRPPLPLPNPKR